MKKFILGLISGLVLVPFAIVCYFVLGLAPAATSDPPMPFEKLIAGAALHAKISREMPAQSPIQGNEANYVAGARIYREDCSVCHGLPQQSVPVIAKGMYPRPPQLFGPHGGVTDDPAGMTFWKVKNGIRLTGMPGFSASLSSDEMWQVSLLLANADKLPASAQQALTNPPPPASGSK